MSLGMVTARPMRALAMYVVCCACARSSKAAVAQEAKMLFSYLGREGRIPQNFGSKTFSSVLKLSALCHIVTQSLNYSSR